MKETGKSILATIIMKAVLSPVGIACLAVGVICLLASIFIFFPQSEGFDKENPEANKDILNDHTGSYATCQPDGELNRELYISQFQDAGVFTGKGDIFIEVAEKYNLDPVLLASIAFHETGFGTSNLVENYNNPGGLYNSTINDFFRYDSLQAGLDAMADNLYDNYYAEGLFTIEQVGQKYAPIGVKNDPNNLNAHWIPTIKKYSSQLGGLIMHCTVTNSDGFVLPTTDPYITSEFGYRTWPDGSVEFHKGLDFDCEKPDPILAAQQGEVVYAQFNNGGYGNLVIIKHQNNVYSAYAHMSELSVQKGDQVKAKQQVGVCGTTGSSTGTHLHFEIQLGNLFGERVKPGDYLDVHNVPSLNGM
ncbi:peptidoglycan DD-metalloendopeptidase family protein [Halobacillus amylolyticus]|uniref:Peptidoglycan DD-metalloendopeptidase family protein n=1 Tax=Halobacillus amylolyticus TaxID=2932259 RepID=A0ABY4HI61_9BACI|nr:peptidoglycan DD-metalloendopeptidase family protein [Halobacillus amylolyticus]UOR14082.1 peptidoglycan DD-metalloendopeptidase family protein [Halobacillus amylolyticus]